MKNHSAINIIVDNTTSHNGTFLYTLSANE